MRDAKMLMVPPLTTLVYLPMLCRINKYMALNMASID